MEIHVLLDPFLLHQVFVGRQVQEEDGEIVPVDAAFAVFVHISQDNINVTLFVVVRPQKVFEEANELRVRKKLRMCARVIFIDHVDSILDNDVDRSAILVSTKVHSLPALVVKPFRFLNTLGFGQLFCQALHVHLF